jgi:hypothetical protein
MSPFLEYLVALAPQGETLLLTEQKPTKTENKFVWPPCFPDKWKAGKAMYANTGSFILDRMPDGKLSASSANCEYVLFLVCDDIGTKSKTPPLPPSWIMETSPNNYQWGYAFSEQPTKAEYSAAIEAIAAAGFTDPGAINPVRNVRLPGSVNLKPGRNAFESVLTEWHREREYTLAEICAAFGVTPAEASTASQIAIRLDDNGNDDVLAWLNEQGMVLERANSSGWVGIICPNHSEHTDGQISGRYHPVTRSYCCLHSHCLHIKSEQFLEWVAEQGGPVHEVGLRDDLLAETMQKVYERLEKGDLFSQESDADALIAAVEERELARIERDEWFKRFAYVIESDDYFDMETRQGLARPAFNALYAGIECKVGNRRVTASAWFDANRKKNYGLVVRGVTYMPGATPICTYDDELYANRWRDGRLRVSGSHSVSAEPWLRLVERIVPNPVERDHLLDVMAFKLQHPEVKINHAILIHGAHGCGKDTIIRGFTTALCGLYERNKSMLDKDSLVSQFNYHVESEVVVVNELRPDDFKDRRQVENILKPLIAAPPEYLTVNRKGEHPYKAINRTLVVAFSNEDDAIALTREDRRWFVICTPAPPMSKPEADAIWNWYLKGGGFGAVANWLMERNVSEFSPGATPPVTAAKTMMIEAARSPAEQFVLDAMDQRIGPFAKGLIGSPLYKVIDALSVMAPNSVKVTSGVLRHALKESSWINLGDIHSKELPSKKQAWCAPGMLELYTRSEMRRMLDEPQATMVRVK